MYMLIISDRILENHSYGHAQNIEFLSFHGADDIKKLTSDISLIILVIQSIFSLLEP